MYKREWEILIQLQKLVAASMLFTVSYSNEVLIGLRDVKQHFRTPLHKTMEKSIKNTSKVNSFFTSTTSDVNDSVIRAEVMHANFIVQHSFSILIVDHLVAMHSKIFLDSNIAQKFGCARTKTTAILNNVIRLALH